MEWLKRFDMINRGLVVGALTLGVFSQQSPSEYFSLNSQSENPNLIAEGKYISLWGYCGSSIADRNAFMESISQSPGYRLGTSEANALLYIIQKNGTDQAGFNIYTDATRDTDIAVMGIYSPKERANGIHSGDVLKGSFRCVQAAD